MVHASQGLGSGHLGAGQAAVGAPPMVPARDSRRRCCSLAVAALLALRASLSNLPASWSSTNDPCGGAPDCGQQSECAWRGVVCEGGRVTEVRLPCLRGRCYDLRGTLPGALAGATALKAIDFRGNSLGGWVGEWVQGAMGGWVQAP